MSILSSPKISTNGLVFAYDMNNTNSYRSPPLQNILTEIEPRGLGTNSFYDFTSGTEDVYIPNLGWIYNCRYVDMYNDYVGGSNNCCPSPYGYGQGLAVSPTTVYTYAIVYKSVNSYTHPNYMYHYEYTSGDSYLTEYGVFYNNGTYSGQVRTLGDDWYWASAKFTTNASAAKINTGSWMYEYGRYNRFYVAKVMLVAGDYTNLHPKFWPALGTTVSNTQALRDLTVQNTITASSLTYATDGTFSFNGSADYITIPNTTLGNGNSEWTVSCWMKTTTTTNDLGQGSILSNQSGGPVYSMLGVNNGKIVYWTYQNSAWAQKLGTGKTVNDGNWHMLTWVNYSNYTMDMYVDGLLDSNVANSTSGNNNPVDRIGGSWAGYFPGSIASLMRYTRALSSNEVLQNFASQRGLYGI
jgi:hypothetical protein